MHGTYTEKLQINEQIKQYTVYTSTVNRRSHVLVDRYERSISQMSMYSPPPAVFLPGSSLSSIAVRVLSSLTIYE